MNVTGLWRGHYTHLSPDGMTTSAPYSFTLELKGNWWGQFQGRAIDQSPAVLPGNGQIRGAARWGSIRFTWTPSSSYQIEAETFRPMDEASGGQPLPIHFTGRVSRSTGAASGTWRVTTWMMQSETRRKIQVILAHGSWQMDNR